MPTPTCSITPFALLAPQWREEGRILMHTQARCRRRHTPLCPQPPGLPQLVPGQQQQVHPHLFPGLPLPPGALGPARQVLWPAHGGTLSCQSQRQQQKGQLNKRCNYKIYFVDPMVYLGNRGMMTRQKMRKCHLPAFVARVCGDWLLFWSDRWCFRSRLRSKQNGEET